MSHKNITSLTDVVARNNPIGWLISWVGICEVHPQNEYGLRLEIVTSEYWFSHSCRTVAENYLFIVYGATNWIQRTGGDGKCLTSDNPAVKKTRVEFLGIVIILLDSFSMEMYHLKLAQNFYHYQRSNPIYIHAWHSKGPCVEM